MRPAVATTFQPRQPDLSRLPRVDHLLDSVAAGALIATFGRPRTRDAIRAELEALRARLRAGIALSGMGLPDRVLQAAAASLKAENAHCLVPVINGTGVVLHTNLGRAPLASAALDAVTRVARGYANLEYDLDAGGRGARDAHVAALLARLTGAQDALVVNNGAAALLLVLSAFARDGEVVASRGELVEIGGGFRIPDVIAQGGARLVEVGTTNRTRVGDYESAIGPHTRLLLRTHPSNFRISGFVARPQRSELAGLSRARGLRLVEDLGSGALVDTARYGLPHETTVHEAIEGGADLLTFSGDKLLGGPQAGIILGAAADMAVLRRHPLLRALRIDKLSLAALEATLRLYEGGVPAEKRVPVLRMLAEPPQRIGRRAGALRRALAASDALDCRVEAGESLPGGGTLPDARLPTMLLRIRVPGVSIDRFATRLRTGRPAVLGRIEDGALLLDLRTIGAGQIRAAAAALTAAATAASLIATHPDA